MWMGFLLMLLVNVVKMRILSANFTIKYKSFKTFLRKFACDFKKNLYQKTSPLKVSKLKFKIFQKSFPKILIKDLFFFSQKLIKNG